MNCRFPPGGRNEPDAEGGFGNGLKSERNAVDGDGAFVYKIFAQTFREFDFKLHVGVAAAERENFCRRVDMAGDDVPAESAVCREGAFHVDGGAVGERTEVRAAECFAHDVEGQWSAAHSLFEREACAVDGNAFARFESGERLVRLHGDFSSFARHFAGENNSGRFDKSGEHD